VVGASDLDPSEPCVPGAEQLGPEEVQVTILGSGDPISRRAQASDSVLIELGNAERTSSSSTSVRDLGGGSNASLGLSAFLQIDDGGPRLGPRRPSGVSPTSGFTTPGSTQMS
jgi:hypothetical protein